MQLKAKDIAKDPIKLEPHGTLYDARNVMVKYNIGRVVITDKYNKALGIITEKDIARFLYQEVPNRHLNEIRLEEVMSKNLITVTEEQDISSCAKIMLENNISSLVVVNNEKNEDYSYPIGIFTKTDLAEAYARHYIGKNSVAQYMAKRVFSIAPDETIHTALMLMISNKVSRIVVTKNNKPVGIITGHDLLPISASFGTDGGGDANRSYWIIQEKSIGKRRKEQHIFIPSGIKEMFLAGDVMTYDPIRITKDSDLAEAALIMMRNRISGIPVIDLDNELVGIITKTDIIRALAASYDALNKHK
jgi:CBS domain-containing protein